MFNSYDEVVIEEQDYFKRKQTQNIPNIEHTLQQYRRIKNQT